MKEYRVLSMHSKQLNRDVRIFVMLPKTYYISEKRYPVLYMHDGHNLFDDKQATFGKSWGILEAYENNPELPEVIIVGLETTGDARNFELCPFEFKFEQQTKTFGGKTDLYLDFLTKDVKPYIDNRFRTYKSNKNTGIMGSSLGGVCSTYAAINYSHYFTRIGCISNAYFIVQEQFEKLAESADLTNIKKIYMDVGTKESSNSIDNVKYVKSNKAIYSLLKEKLQSTQIKFEVIEDAIHNEAAWEARFPDIIKFLFND